MRILLVRVAADTRYMQAMYKVVRMEPLSLEYLGAAVREHHDVKLLDMRLEGGWAGLQRTLETFQPHVVGTGGDTCESNGCKKVCSAAKKLDPKILTVVGGIHATTLPGDLLHPDIDLVCVNEGVNAFREIVERLERGGDFKEIHGLGVNENGVQHLTPARPIAQLDTLPFPDRSLTADVRNKYGFSLWGKHLALMRFTQGCVGRCDFCPSWAQTDALPKTSVESMLAELDDQGRTSTSSARNRSTPSCPSLAKASGRAIGKHFGMPLRRHDRPEAGGDRGLGRSGAEDTIVGIEQATTSIWGPRQDDDRAGQPRA